MPQELVDAVRICHLAFFALGLGAGCFFDWRALCRINIPFSEQDISLFESAHSFVFFALAGLWATGLYLIYIRTGFVLSEFSPKLWAKIIIVCILTVNAFAIGSIVMARIRRSVGVRAIEMPLVPLASMTFTTALSMFCWLGGLALGASVVLKTATWSTLGTVLLIEFAVIMATTYVVVLGARAEQRIGSRRAQPDRGTA